MGGCWSRASSEIGVCMKGAGADGGLRDSKKTHRHSAQSVHAVLSHMQSSSVGQRQPLSSCSKSEPEQAATTNLCAGKSQLALQPKPTLQYDLLDDL